MIIDLLVKLLYLLWLSFLAYIAVSFICFIFPTISFPLIIGSGILTKWQFSVIVGVLVLCYDIIVGKKDKGAKDERKETH